MQDFIERAEDLAEQLYSDNIQPDGRFKCACGRIFDPDAEGGNISPDPWAMPACGECLDVAMNSLEAASSESSSGEGNDQRQRQDYDLFE